MEDGERRRTRSKSDAAVIRVTPILGIAGVILERCLIMVLCLGRVVGGKCHGAVFQHLRQETGDSKPMLLVENLRAYRLAHEAISDGGELQNEQVEKMRNSGEGVGSSVLSS